MIDAKRSQFAFVKLAKGLMTREHIRVAVLEKFFNKSLSGFMRSIKRKREPRE